MNVASRTVNVCVVRRPAQVRRDEAATHPGSGPGASLKIAGLASAIGEVVATVPRRHQRATATMVRAQRVSARAYEMQGKSRQQAAAAAAAAA